jgi:hypothetical protein
MVSEDPGAATATTGQPAWRILVPFYSLLITALVLAAWTTRPALPLATSARLERINPAMATPHIQAELKLADTGRALSKEDLERTIRFLNLQAQAAGMHISGIVFQEGVPLAGVIPVDARFSLDGDPYHLPIFLDGLYRQRTINHPLSVSADGGGRYVRFNILLRYYRPEHDNLTWIPARLAMEAPVTDGQHRVLEDAARLTEWRHFRAQERRLTEEAEAIREQTAQQFVASLIAMRDGQGVLRWHHEPWQQGRP